MARTKLTYEMVEVAAELRDSGLCDADVAAGMGVHRATLYRWLADPDTEVKRALCDRLKKANAGFKRTSSRKSAKPPRMGPRTGRRPPGFSNASGRMSTLAASGWSVAKGRLRYSSRWGYRW